jgi:SnoaL-like domain
VTDDSPEVIRRYLRAADEGDFETLAACFTPAGIADLTYRFDLHDGAIAALNIAP